MQDDSQKEKVSEADNDQIHQLVESESEMYNLYVDESQTSLNKDLSQLQLQENEKIEEWDTSNIMVLKSNALNPNASSNGLNSEPMNRTVSNQLRQKHPYDDSIEHGEANPKQSSLFGLA